MLMLSPCLHTFYHEPPFAPLGTKWRCQLQKSKEEENSELETTSSFFMSSRCGCGKRPRLWTSVLISHLNFSFPRRWEVMTFEFYLCSLWHHKGLFSGPVQRLALKSLFTEQRDIRLKKITLVTCICLLWDLDWGNLWMRCRLCQMLRSLTFSSVCEFVTTRRR